MATSERVTFVVTNLIKLGGLAVVINEAFVEPLIRSEALMVAAIMMAGAQSLETFFHSFFGSKR
jgi:hypothetical protein